ncbi:MAG: hypothetical protein ACRDZW_01455 [Acidimicrobiales bacterium]
MSLICLVFFFGHSPVLGGDRLSEAAATHLAKANLGHGLPFSSYRRVELRGGGFAVERHWLGIADGHSVVDGDDGSFRVQKSPNSGTGTYARLGFGVVLPGALILLALAPRRRVREPSGD